MLHPSTGISPDSQTATRLSSNSAGWIPISGQASSCDWLIVLACWILRFLLLEMLLHVGLIVGSHQSLECGCQFRPRGRAYLSSPSLS